MTQTIRPWLEVVTLHPDVLSQDFSEDIFALDLGRWPRATRTRRRCIVIRNTSSGRRI